MSGTSMRTVLAVRGEYMQLDQLMKVAWPVASGGASNEARKRAT